MILAVLLIVGAVVGGAVAHELTHYVVALVYRREPGIIWSELNVYWSGMGVEVDHADAAIGGAPVVAGLAFTPVVAYAWFTLAPVWSLSILVAWVIYTIRLPGALIGASKEDYGYARYYLGGSAPEWAQEVEG